MDDLTEYRQICNMQYKASTDRIGPHVTLHWGLRSMRGELSRQRTGIRIAFRICEQSWRPRGKPRNRRTMVRRKFAGSIRLPSAIYLGLWDQTRGRHAMKSSVAKRKDLIAARKTSVSLEAPF
jgi:hypothetical protein